MKLGKNVFLALAAVGMADSALAEGIRRALAESQRPPPEG